MSGAWKRNAPGGRVVRLGFQQYLVTQSFPSFSFSAVTESDLILGPGEARALASNALSSGQRDKEMKGREKKEEKESSGIPGQHSSRVKCERWIRRETRETARETKNQ